LTWRTNRIEPPWLAESTGVIDKLPGQGLHMPIETNALARRPEPEAPDEDAYLAFCTALSSSARGRWFLEEYTKRNRNTDTQVVLAALERLEARIASDRAAVEHLRKDLSELLIAIRGVRPDGQAGRALEHPPELAGLLELLEHRIDSMEPPPVADGLGTPAAPVAPEQEMSRVHLMVVPPPEEPELPIPSPVAAQSPAISLVGTAAIMPSPFDNAPSAPAVIARSAAAIREEKPAPPSDANAIAGTSEDDFWMHTIFELMPPAFAETSQSADLLSPTVQLNVETEVRTEAHAEADFECSAEAAAPIADTPATMEADPVLSFDPLAALMALSPDERLALFT
jgi:hypothetical protein